MATDRALDKASAQAIEQEQRRQPFELPFAAVSKVLEVEFPATTVRDVAHGLGEVPAGVLLLLETGGSVLSATPHLWTKDIALMQASAANTRALVLFFTLREAPIDA